MHAPARHFINRHSGAPAFDVPPRFIHGGKDLVVERAAAPAGAIVGSLAGVFNAVRALTGQPGFRCFSRAVATAKV